MYAGIFETIIKLTGQIIFHRKTFYKEAVRCINKLLKIFGTISFQPEYLNFIILCFNWSKNLVVAVKNNVYGVLLHTPPLILIRLFSYRIKGVPRGFRDRWWHECNTFFVFYLRHLCQDSKICQFLSRKYQF